MPSYQGRRYCFTLNNYTPVEEQAVADFLSCEDVRYGVYGREVGESGTPHLQGFLILTRQRTIHWLRQRIARAHFEGTRGTSGQARDYCKKDNDFNEYGQFPGNQGRRSDLDELLTWAQDFEVEHQRPPNSPEVAQEYPEQYIRYPRLVRALFHRADPIQLRDPDGQELREWQDFLEQELDDQADDRSVIFYVDEDGGKGKTWFQQYYISKYPRKSQLLTIGKRDDLALAVDETKTVFFFNVPRGGMEFLQYPLLEQLKDRMVFSPKYNSRMKVFRTNIHVVVFSNEDPDMDKMSEDRYDIRRLG